MTPVEILKAVDALFDDPSKWVKGARAQAKGKYTVPPRASTAICWCLNGAIMKVSETESEAIEAQHLLGRGILYTFWVDPELNVAAANDAKSTTFQDIKDWLQNAIELGDK